MSLVDLAGTPAPTEGTPPTTPPVTPAAPVVVQNDWYYDENIKGNGDKPDWLKESKYKSVTEQAKAYTEIEKKLGAFKGAPDTYDLALSDFPDIKFSNDDPMIKDFLDGAKKNGVSQEYVSELLTTYAQALTHNIPDKEAELAKLGPNGKQEIQNLTSAFSQRLNKDEFAEFTGMLKTASSVRFFEKVLNLMNQGDVAPPTPPKHNRESEAEVLALVSDPRYDTDEAFRADVKKRLTNAMGVK